MEALGIASGVAGIISLGITVCQGLLEYYGSWKDAQASVAQMYASIEALTKTLKLLETALKHEHFLRNIVARVEECIRSVENGFQSLQKKLEKVRLVPSEEGWKARAKSQFRRTQFPFKESTLVKLKELGNELRDDLSLALSLLQVDSSGVALHKLDLVGRRVAEVSTNVSVLGDRSTFISKNVKDMKAVTLATSKSINGLVLIEAHNYKRKVCDWLSPLSVEFQKKQLDTFNIQNRQDGTAQWFLETSEFNNWLSGTGTSLWCPGIAGTGKTVLASCIIDHIQSIVDHKDHRLAYTYISYKDAEKQTVTNLMMSLISQLAISESHLPEELVACYETHGSGVSRPSHAESTQLFQSIVTRCAKVFLIIDAFDECSEECRNVLLTELQHLQPKINLLITSRELPNIESQLANATRLEVQAKQDDILHYLQERIAHSERIQTHAKRDFSLCSLISTTIAARAEGMFLQARLHLDSLATTTTLRKLKEALVSLPEGLNKTYDETFERVHAQSPDQANLARKAVYWVFFACRPLKMLELQHALAVETGDQILDEENIPDEGLLLSVCNGLLIYQREGGFLSLVHYTLQQYLELKAAILFPEAQKEMARTSLTYLMFVEFGKGPCDGDQALEGRLSQWPLLHYAVFQWGQHARDSAEESCKDLIFSFFSQSANLSASVQILCVRESKGPGYSHDFPNNVHALWLASFYGLLDTVAWLLAKDKGGLLSRTTWQDTALHRAAGCGHVKVVELLLEHGADPCVKDSAGNTPLHLATLFRNTISAHDIFKSTLLANRGRIVQSVRTLRYSLAVKQSLLIHGADVDAVNLRGESALHLAVCDGHKSLSRLLLDSGADITLKDRNGLAPLSIATECGHIGVTNTLLEYDLPKQIHLGVLDDALRRAVHKDHLPLLKVLISKSPKVLPTDPEGKNLLHMSSYEGRLKCLTYLADFGVDLHALDKQGRSCLHHAAAGREEILEVLLDHGLDPRLPDVDGWTPLVWAAKGGPKVNVLRLLNAGGLPENGKEWIPYAVAMFYGATDVAALLVTPGQTLPDIVGGQQPRSSLLHPRILCDGCDRVSGAYPAVFPNRLELTFSKLVFGSQYHCTACADFDYCFKCIRSAKITHPGHDFKSVYWNDEEAQKSDPVKVMKEIEAREAMMMATMAPA